MTHMWCCWRTYNLRGSVCWEMYSLCTESTGIATLLPSTSFVDTVHTWTHKNAEINTWNKVVVYNLWWLGLLVSIYCYMLECMKSNIYIIIRSGLNINYEKIGLSTTLSIYEMATLADNLICNIHKHTRFFHREKTGHSSAVRIK